MAERASFKQVAVPAASSYQKTLRVWPLDSQASQGQHGVAWPPVHWLSCALTQIRSNGLLLFHQLDGIDPCNRLHAPDIEAFRHICGPVRPLNIYEADCDTLFLHSENNILLFNLEIIKHIAKVGDLDSTIKTFRGVNHECG